MRKLLATAVAMAPLAIASGAMAQTQVTNERTTPIATATADNGQPDDVVIATNGNIVLREGTAVTLNSDNDVTISSGGRITMSDAADGATGILALGGNEGSITIGGAINITDDYEATDDDEDGDIDGPFAEGTGRYGVRIMGDEALVGNIELQRSGAIRVEGNESYGISIESDLIGDLRTFGAINILGDNSYGLRATGNVDGEVFLGGGITAQGENTVGASFEGDIDGPLTIQAAISATGFRYSTRPPASVIENLDPDDLLVGGPALRIAGNVQGGVLLGTTPVPPEDDEEDEDEDGDEDEDTNGNGVPDAQETRASVSSFGSSPAIEIGAADRDITLGAVGEGDEAYGFINRGSVVANGIFDGFAATAVQVGLEDGGAVTIAGGFRNEGQIASVAYEANSTGVSIGSNVTAEEFYNRGVIETTAVAEGDFNATALLIDTDAVVNSLDNAGGTISARVAGETGDAYAVRDLSGGLTDIANQGRIVAGVTRTITGDQTGQEPITGRGIAIDVSANTTGVTIVQTGIPYEDDGDEDTDPPTDTDGDGVPDDAEPTIVGEILLGSGADTLDIRNGTVLGDISFGDGADSLLISGGAAVRGSLSNGDGQLAIDVADGLLDARQTNQIDITSLNVGAEGDLIVTVDPENDGIGGFRVNGTATLADGAGLGLRFASLLQEDSRFVIIDADELNYGDIDTTSLEENSPYLFVVDAGADLAAGQVYIDARRRTGEEIGFIASENAAYDAVYGALGNDTELRDAFLAQADRDGFIELYEQLLPDHSGGPLMSLASGVDAVTRALAGRNDTARPGETSAWLQEINFYAEKDRGQSYGFESEGFGLAGGIERGTSMGAFGISTAFTSSDLEDDSSRAEEVLSANLIELGLYYRAQGQNWNVWARAAAGYAFFDAKRSFVGAGLFRNNESEWNGFSLAAAAGANYERHFGRYSIRPEAFLEYFSLSEDGRTETGGGDGFDLTIEDRDGHLFAATAAVAVGVGFGQDYWFRPELRLGWKQNISFDPGETVARFSAGGDPFTLLGDSIEGGGPIIGFRLNLGNDLGMLSIEGDAEMIDDYVRYALLLRASFRF